MIILDTNVISELMRELPDPNVKQWITAQKPIYLGITTPRSPSQRFEED